MDFATGQIYHVFNRSNNSIPIFMQRQNYMFFLTGIKEYILPYTNILAWCLMPSHFHLMIEVVNVRIEIPAPIYSAIDQRTKSIDPMTGVHRINSSNISKTVRAMNFSHRPNSTSRSKERTLNDSIAIFLRSYTRAINKKYNWHGSLFQQHTKAICLTEPLFAPAYFQTHFGMMGNLDLPETNYLNVCFNYIHMNPVNDRLVTNPEDWEFSSYRDYFCERNGKLINRKSASELGLVE